jgi:hypothetical protein
MAWGEGWEWNDGWNGARRNDEHVRAGGGGKGESVRHGDRFPCASATRRLLSFLSLSLSLSSFRIVTRVIQNVFKIFYNIKFYDIYIEH